MQRLVQNSEEQRKVLHLLGVCQILELSIKLFICRKQHFIELKKGKNIPSEQIYREIQDFPLGILIKRLKKLGVNHGLVEKLEIIKEDRDYLAHQALLNTYNLPIGFLEKVNKPRKELSFLALNNQMTECLTLISQESQNYSAD